MDIEGAEILALKGATSLLQQQRPHVWILELLNGVNHGYCKQDYRKIAARLWLWFIPLQRRYQQTSINYT